MFKENSVESGQVACAMKSFDVQIAELIFSLFLSLSFSGYLTVTSADHWHYAEEEPNGVVKGESNASRASR